MIELFFEVGPGKPNSCSHPGIHISYSFIVVSYTFWLFVYLYIFVEAFQLKHFSSRNLAIAAEDASGIREEATTGEERGEERADAPSVTKGEVCGEAADTGEEIAEGPGTAR